MTAGATSGTSSVIAQEMARVLESDPPSPDRDFFHAGGDSGRAVELISAIVDRFGGATGDAGERLASALLIAVFDDASPDALAAVVDDHR